MPQTDLAQVLAIAAASFNTLAVAPHLRRRGAARALFQVLRRAAARGAERATLEVRSANTSALLLYAGFGFAVARIRPGYSANPVDDAFIL